MLSGVVRRHKSEFDHGGCLDQEAMWLKTAHLYCSGGCGRPGREGVGVVCVCCGEVSRRGWGYEIVVIRWKSLVWRGKKSHLWSLCQFLSLFHPLFLSLSLGLLSLSVSLYCSLTYSLTISLLSSFDWRTATWQLSGSFWRWWSLMERCTSPARWIWGQREK